MLLVRATLDPSQIHPEGESEQHEGMCASPSQIHCQTHSCKEGFEVS